MTNMALEGLDEKTIDRDPIKQFQLWFNDAIAAGLPMPEAMTLATATRDGKPSARMVLLKQVNHDGFVFFTNYQSAKAAQLDANPYAALWDSGTDPVSPRREFDSSVAVPSTPFTVVRPPRQ